MDAPGQNKKQTIIARMYTVCRERSNLTFNNDEVRDIANELGFKNYFDATKIDNSARLPEALRRDDVFVVHLGRGRHRFVHGIAEGYHNFELIPEERRRHWQYNPSILNNVNTSESNIISVAYNQLVLQDFLYGSTSISPRVYGSNRTRITLIYRVGNDTIDADRVQVEIDLTLEHMGEITAFEAKNGTPRDFNVFQLFNPYRYYLQATEGMGASAIQCCYLLRKRNRRLGDRLRLYLYTFTDPQNPGSIRLERNAEYTLVPR